MIFNRFHIKYIKQIRTNLPTVKKNQISTLAKRTMSRTVHLYASIEFSGNTHKMPTEIKLFHRLLNLQNITANLLDLIREKLNL